MFGQEAFVENLLLKLKEQCVYLFKLKARMKTKFPIIYLFLFIVISVSGQRFKGGALVGINAAQIDGDHYSGFHKLGLLAGAFVNTDFTQKFGGQLEIKFSGKGSSNPPRSVEIKKIRLNYIDVPVLFYYKPKDLLKLEAGVSINYLYSAAYYNGGWSNNWVLEPNSLETALVFGVNYSLLRRVDVNVRYSYSMYPVRSRFSSSNFSEGAWFNNMLQFAFYINFGD